MRIARLAFIAASLLLCAQTARAEYVVLRSGQRLVVIAINWSATPTDFQLSAAQRTPRASRHHRPEEVFHSTPRPALADIPYASFIQSATLPSWSGRRPDRQRHHRGIQVQPESHFPQKRSRLMQLLPETATRLGVKNIFDPQENRSRHAFICVSFSRVTTTISL